jgi:hypothetical protein
MVLVKLHLFLTILLSDLSKGAPYLLHSCAANNLVTATAFNGCNLFSSGTPYDRYKRRRHSQHPVSTQLTIGEHIFKYDRKPSLRATEEDALIPEEYEIQSTSSSGVPFGDVKSALDIVYPPKALQQRNAVSRTDGYWSYVNDGKDPPQHLTYGEFDFYFFAHLLEVVLGHLKGTQSQNSNSWRDKVFVDVGSGAGRLVMGAAALHPEARECRGVEILPSLHGFANGILQSCRLSTPAAEIGLDGSVSDAAESNGLPLPIISANSNALKEEQKFLPLALIDYVCASFEDPYACYLGDADIIFVFSSCMSAGMMSSLSQTFGRQCAPGTIIITTEFPLTLLGKVSVVEDDPRIPSGEFSLELLDTTEGKVWLTGGASTAYIHRVKSSMWEKGAAPFKRPVLSKEEQAYRLVLKMEAGELTDTTKFMRNVYNNMMFTDVPREWLPKLDGT